MDSDLTARIIEFRDQRDWHQFHTYRNLAASIVVEAAELLEVFQWARDDELTEIAVQKRSQIEEEIADVSIYLAILAHDLGINLGDAVERKLAINAQKYPVERARGSAAKYSGPPDGSL